MDLFDWIADERRGIADRLETLTDEQWEVQSLCAAWTVREVAGHLLMPLVTPLPKFMVQMIRHRMDFDRTNIAVSKSVARRPTSEIIGGLRAHAGARFTPPGLGPESPLTDVLVHGEDMWRPLGLSRRIREDRQLKVLEYMTDTDSRGFVPRTRAEGLRFVASDLEFQAGEGPEVSGPAASIMMAIYGRPVALRDLDGAGVEVLAGRIST